MAHHSKLRKPKKKPPEVPLDIDTMLDDELTRIQALRASISQNVEDGIATPALVRESNGLSRALANVSAELRQRDKHVQLKLDRLSPKDEDAIVMEYLEGLPRPRRKEFLERLQELDNNNDLLAL